MFSFSFFSLRRNPLLCCNKIILLMYQCLPYRRMVTFSRCPPDVGMSEDRLAHKAAQVKLTCGGVLWDQRRCIHRVSPPSCFPGEHAWSAGEALCVGGWCGRGPVLACDGHVGALGRSGAYTAWGAKETSPVSPPISIWISCAHADWLGREGYLYLCVHSPWHPPHSVVECWGEWSQVN